MESAGRREAANQERRVCTCEGTGGNAVRLTRTVKSLRT